MTVTTLSKTTYTEPYLIPELGEIGLTVADMAKTLKKKHSHFMDYVRRQLPELRKVQTLVLKNNNGLPYKTLAVSEEDARFLLAGNVGPEGRAYRRWLCARDQEMKLALSTPLMLAVQRGDTAGMLRAMADTIDVYESQKALSEAALRDTTLQLEAASVKAESYDMVMSDYEEAVDFIEKEALPAIEALDALAGATGNLSMQEAAAALGGIGRSTLFLSLRQHGIMPWKERVPFQYYQTQGYFEVEVSTYTQPDGTVKMSFKPMVTPKGLVWLTQKLKEWEKTGPVGKLDAFSEWKSTQRGEV